MYISKSLNTPRSLKKPLDSQSTPKGKRKGGAFDAGLAAGAPTHPDKTAVFFISPLSNVKEDVLRYYEINKE